MERLQVREDDHHQTLKYRENEMLNDMDEEAREQISQEAAASM